MLSAVSESISDNPGGNRPKVRIIKSQNQFVYQFRSPCRLKMFSEAIKQSRNFSNDNNCGTQNLTFMKKYFNSVIGAFKNLPHLRHGNAR